MENLNITEEYQLEIKEFFKDFVSEDIYETWGDTFEIECNDNQVVVNYHGTESIKQFKKECKKTLVACIYTIVGRGKKIIITSAYDTEVTKNDSLGVEIPETKNNSAEIKNSNSKKNVKAIKFFVIGMLFVCIATAVIIILCNYIGNRSFTETFYNTSSIKVDGNIRVIQLSDLHNVSYGKNNQKLIDRVKALQPDIIICTGDMVDSVKKDTDSVVALGKEFVGIAPTYYIYGNHEVDDIYGFSFLENELDKKFGFNKDNRDETALLKINDPFEQALENAGVKVLKNEKDTIKVKTISVDVYGVLNSNPSSFWSYSEKAFLGYLNENPDNLKITAVHEPFIFEEFQPEYWGDLMVCGHTHGGLMRVPILGPLYTPEGGLFPERGSNFAYGRKDVAGSPLIISGGLENTNILRINNQPELVVIDINKF